MKARKKRYKEYRQQIISSLDSLHDNNPKAYWSLLEKLKKDNKDGNINPISDDTWYNYFNDLNISKTTRFHNSSVDAELSGLEKLYILTELDYRISAIEIYSAIGSSKNKSCGLDSLLNEMLNCSLHITIQSLLKIFRNIFYGHSLPSADSRRAIVSFWRKNVHNTG